METVPVWLKVAAVATPIVVVLIGLGLWVLRAVIREVIRDLIGSEFDNGVPRDHDDYIPLRAAFDNLGEKVERTLYLVGHHEHDVNGRVVAPIYSGDG